MCARLDFIEEVVPAPVFIGSLLLELLAFRLRFVCLASGMIRTNRGLVLHNPGKYISPAYLLTETCSAWGI
jgi:hypothetical protein